MNKTDPLERHKALTRQEYDFFKANRPEMYTLAGDLKDVLTNLTSYERTGHRWTHGAAPRPSLQFISEVFNSFSYPGITDQAILDGLNLVGRLLLPQAGVSQPVTTPAAGNLAGGYQSSCQDAEMYFAKTVDQVKTGVYAGQRRVSVYHDQDGTPLAIRKTTDVPTALTLRPIQIHDTILPGGTIINIDEDMNNHRTGVSYSDQGKAHKLETYDVGEALDFYPLRLSAWAYDEPLDQALFALGQAENRLTYDAVRAEHITSYQLADFEQAAQTIMGLCGAQLVAVS